MINATFLRKVFSAVVRLSKWISTARCYFWACFNENISIGSGCSFGRNVFLTAIGGGTITIGRRCSISDQVRVVVENGCLVLGDDVFIGPGSIIVCRNSISIGSETQIAEYVTIRDQDHRTSPRPILTSGFNTSVVSIGSDVWIGCKASVLRGACIGDRCVIGAHALVNSMIPSDMLAVGIPARVVREV